MASGTSGSLCVILSGHPGGSRKAHHSGRPHRSAAAGGRSHQAGQIHYTPGPTGHRPHPPRPGGREHQVGDLLQAVDRHRQVPGQGLCPAMGLSSSHDAPRIHLAVQVDPKRHGLPEHRNVHSLRHTWESLLIANDMVVGLLCRSQPSFD